MALVLPSPPAHAAPPTEARYSAPSLYMTQRKTDLMSRRPLAIPLLAALLAFSLYLPLAYAQGAADDKTPAAVEKQRPGGGRSEPERKPTAADALPADAATP